MPKQDGVTIPDGSVSWSGGVDSILVTTIQSPLNPNGLRRDMLAWLDNATVRDGGISPRDGWSLLGQVHDGTGLFQGMFMYDASAANPPAFPYLLVGISGHIYKVVPGTPPVITDLSALSNQYLPTTQLKFYFVQAEQFVVIQAGDNVTLPLIYDGNTLRRSRGITNTAVAPGTPGVNEIPAGTAMDYFMGRIWWANGRVGNAGDIVNGPSGTATYGFDDSVLNVTESPLIVGGDGISLPAQSGNIRAIFHNANLNSALGQGSLFFATPKDIYSLVVPVTRAQWIATTINNGPSLTPAQIVNGVVSERSVVQVNGDIYYQSLEPGIRSLFASVRNFGQAGNIEISAQENRILQFNNRALLNFASGIVFNNRLLQTQLPTQLPQGVVHQALAPLDFVPMSTFAATQQPIWEGSYEGLQFLQLATGNFGGLERGFALQVSQLDSSIELWEILQASKFDANRTTSQARIKWYAEFPAFTWGDFFQLKRLVSAELWIDRVFGPVDLNMEFRPDAQTCWLPWRRWQFCSARTSCEDLVNPICYPLVPYGESYRATMSLPAPNVNCETATGRPADIAYQFQPRLTITGFCRVRGVMLKATAVDESLYHALVC